MRAYAFKAKLNTLTDENNGLAAAGITPAVEAGFVESPENSLLGETTILPKNVL